MAATDEVSTKSTIECHSAGLVLAEVVTDAAEHQTDESRPCGPEERLNGLPVEAHRPERSSTPDGQHEEHDADGDDDGTGSPAQHLLHFSHQLSGWFEPLELRDLIEF